MGRRSRPHALILALGVALLLTAWSTHRESPVPARRPSCVPVAPSVEPVPVAVAVDPWQVVLTELADLDRRIAVAYAAYPEDDSDEALQRIQQEITLRFLPDRLRLLDRLEFLLGPSADLEAWVDSLASP